MDLAKTIREQIKSEYQDPKSELFHAADSTLKTAFWNRLENVFREELLKKFDEGNKGDTILIYTVNEMQKTETGYENAGSYKTCEELTYAVYNIIDEEAESGLDDERIYKKDFAFDFDEIVKKYDVHCAMLDSESCFYNEMKEDFAEKSNKDLKFTIKFQMSQDSMIKPFFDVRATYKNKELFSYNIAFDIEEEDLKRRDYNELGDEITALKKLYNFMKKGE